KWISLYFVGVEAWCDYRRTGYPLLKTNGPAADNKNVLPTRLRYPADEEYRNPQTYREAVDGWLGGVDNMRTEVWWADTQESRDLRLKGRI
ncbi:MAG: SusD/RagB family nutrient-binding outer membrane lipoprotein, partial [Bacteroidales bacterium]|nr:SusD/RagB family nutrient-binding outer membrane lipoprotein [Bacteroidales bacterium]